MSKQINSRKLRSTNRQSKDAKLVIENIVDNKNVIVGGDQEKTKKGAVVDNMLLDSPANLEGNKIDLNNGVKRGNKLKRKSKISEKIQRIILKLFNFIY